MAYYGWPKCDACGRFIAGSEMQTGGGGSWKYVPSSDAPSQEENAQRCKRCTDKLGPPTPWQNVRLDMCCGVY